MAFQAVTDRSDPGCPLQHQADRISNGASGVAAPCLPTNRASARGCGAFGYVFDDAKKRVRSSSG